MAPTTPSVRAARLHWPLSDMVTTTIFITNLHCPSCIISIQESLRSLSPAPVFVSYSIVSHSVVIRHEPSLAVGAITGTLEVAGFDIHSVFQDQPSAQDPVEVLNPVVHNPEWQNSLEQAVTRWTQSRTHNFTSKVPQEMSKRQRHVEQCEQCKAESGGVTLESQADGTFASKLQPAVTVLEKIPDEDDIIVEVKSPISDAFVVVDSPSEASLYKATLGLSGMTCSSCVSSITHAVQQLSYVRSIDVNLLTSSGVAVFEGKHRIDELVSAIEDVGFDATVEKLEELHSPASSSGPRNLQPLKWRATYAIGGMTCSSCVGNVTNAFKPHSWIEKVDVNLVSNSASVFFSGKEHLEEIQEIIEDAGYEATLDNVVSEEEQEAASDRSVRIKVDGIFCHHCPGRIVEALMEKFNKKFTFEVEDPRLTQKNPVLSVRYLPSPPEFTIRNIVQTIADLDPAFIPSIYHPPTIEERAREMHARDRKWILIRLVFAIIVAIPTFLFGIVFMSLIKSNNPLKKWVMQPIWAGNAPRVSWILFFLSTPVYLFSAYTFHVRAMKELWALWRPGSRTPFLPRFFRFGSMNMLISLGTTIAYLASIVELGLAATENSDGSMSDSYFDSVVFLTMFLLIGRFLEAYSKAKTGDAVTSLGKLRPDQAVLVDATAGDQRIATDLLEIGDIVRVAHGTSPPFDGAIVEGSADFDESSLTGESRPVKKEVGDTVFSGTINKGAPIKVKLTTVSGTSMLDQIINVVREGQTRRAPVERVADSITSHFVPFVTLVAVVTWIIWLILGSTGAIPDDWRDEGSGGWALWSLRFAIAVFVIACPCGIGLAAPTALFVGGGLAAKHGILVKGGGEAFQEASSLDCIVFDKTGTLTQGGDPAVTDHEVGPGHSFSTVLGIVKTLEESSSHPIARALVAFCASQSHKAPDVVNIDEIPGKGLKGTFKIGGDEVQAIIGNESFMFDHHVVIPTATMVRLGAWKREGKSVALTAMLSQSNAYSQTPDRKSSITETLSTAQTETTPKPTWQFAAAFSISDPLRPEAASVISSLQAQGIDVWMLSGDNEITASAVGAQVGIPSSNIIAGVLPDQKAQKIKYLQRTLAKSRKAALFKIPFLSTLLSKRENSSKRAIVAMVGDGINDAPALSTSDLSIAIGSGSDIAISSSSFILINSHLTTLLTLLQLSRTVFRRVYFNFGWALVYNLVAMPIAAGVLFPITTGDSNMGMHHNGVGMDGGMAMMGKQGVRHVRLDPVWASLAMALSSVSVVCSSLLLRSRLPGLGFRGKKTVDGINGAKEKGSV